MQFLLRLSRFIDRITMHVGTLAMLMIAAAVFISTGNAVARKLFSLSSNAMLEIQWYLFSAVFLLGAGYALLRNAHVRIDFLSSRFSPRTRNLIDIGGILLVIVPLCALLIEMSMPLFLSAYQTGEMSPDAGGLLRWPVLMTVPLGMVLLLAQSGSEIIKRIAFLGGYGPDPLFEKSEQESIDELIAEGEALVAEVTGQHAAPTTGADREAK
ncbi:TRAP transporter small permease subunit [Castellaniella sp. S9]|uniref:TRAP transporter small permease subunit n=1 Tax=Castellaniella sp. S9 TaxID=2993652 RepID=UPI0022B4D2AA|nr:TRAP transporter small permease subunit [Castellaniella sp. S9]